MGPAPEPRKPKVMRVSTRCRTIDELIAAFATLVDEHSLVVLTDQQRTIGSRQPFVVELADGTFVMKGEAEVVESTPPPRGRLRLKFLALDASGREVHQRMLERKKGTGGTARQTMPLGMKPLVRIPEVGSGRVEQTPAPPPAPAAKPAPPAPFARPVPSVPSVPSVPAPTLPRAPTSVPVPVVPPRTTAAGTSPGARKLPAPPPVPSVPSVPRVPPVAGGALKPGAGVPVTDPGAGLPSFEDLPDLADRTAVDSSLPAAEPAPPPASAPTIEEALAAEAAKPRPATAPLEGDRTPGSPYILPANPFGDVASESLEAFVECTVYEETGQFSLGEDGSLINELAMPSQRDDGDEPVDPPTMPAFPMYSGDARPAAATPVIEPPPPVIAPPPPVIAPPPPAAVVAPPPPVIAPPPVVEAPPKQVVAAPPASAVPEQAWPPFDASGPVRVPVPTPIGLNEPAPKRTPWKWIGIGAAVLGLIVLIVILTSGSESDSRAAAGGDAGTAAGKGTGSGKKPAVTVDAGAHAAAIDAGAAPDDAAEAVAAAPDAGVTSPPIAPDECHLKLTVEPDGAHLKLAGVKIGDPPFDGPIPCAAAPLVIYRSHYETIIKRIKPERGEPVVMDIKMVRPMYKVTIVSTPPGAQIKLDGASLGKAPVSTTVKGWTRIKVEATLKGFQPWSKTLEVEKSSQKIVAPLKKVRSR